MWTRAELKARGKQAFKQNYWPCVAAGFLLLLFAAGTGAATSRQTQTQNVTEAFDAMPPDERALVTGIAIGTVITIMIVALLLRIFLFNPIEVGCHRFFRKNIQTGNANLNVIGEGFSQYGRSFITLFLRDLFITLFTLLLIIPGIMKAYSYRMVPYIVTENPELAPMEVLARSTRMMKGNRWNAFVLDLSFLGWLLLGAITLNIVNIFWTQPYMCSTDAALFDRLNSETY